MLNQVPRTLLNIGVDPSIVERDPDVSPPFHWNSLTIAADTKEGDGLESGSALITPHAQSSRVNGGSTSSRRGAEFFGAGAGYEDGAPPPLPAARGRGARAGEKGSKGEGGPPVTPATGWLRSAFTNESIADQALNDFGDGTVSNYPILYCTILYFILLSLFCVVYHSRRWADENMRIPWGAGAGAGAGRCGVPDVNRLGPWYESERGWIGLDVWDKRCFSNKSFRRTLRLGPYNLSAWF